MKRKMMACRKPSSACLLAHDSLVMGQVLVACRCAKSPGGGSALVSPESIVYVELKQFIHPELSSFLSCEYM